MFRKGVKNMENIESECKHTYGYIYVADTNRVELSSYACDIRDNNGFYFNFCPWCGQDLRD
ncbi:MAG: hypothetical protein R3250_04410 [Melioribacteraceae bacterium]|nr:hypothetical protein [Melioribacteraceae bacterium]